MNAKTKQSGTETKIIIDHEHYGSRSVFNSIEEAQSAVRACGSDFTGTVFTVRGTDVLDEDGLIVGEVTSDTWDKSAAAGWIDPEHEVGGVAAKHTPGPWSLQSKVNVETVYPFSDWRQDVIGPPDPAKANSSVVVATIINRDSPYGEANARLIAAAPELLEACKYGLRAMRALGWDQATTTGLKHDWDAANAAIAKAEGRVS